jgi:aspartate kinase
MHNNDPRIVKKTVPISELTFDEASELAYFGAKILHPSTIVPAQKYNVPVRLKNTMDEKALGTIITEKGSEGSFKAVAAKDGITAIKIKSSRMLMAYGFLRRVFEVFESYKTPIDMIATSEVAVSLTIDTNAQLPAIETELKKFGTIEVDKDQSIICIVGNKIMNQQGVLGKVFLALDGIPIRMVSCGGSANNVSVLVDKQYKDKALNLLNEGLFNLK